VDGPTVLKRANRRSSPLQRLHEDKLASLEAAGQGNDERDEVVLPAWRVLMGFEHAPRTIAVGLVEFGGDRKVDQASNAGEDFIRRFERSITLKRAT